MKATDTNIEQLVNAKDFRESLRAPYLDMANNALVATDGHALAVIPCDTDDAIDVGGPVPVEALKQARKRGNLLACGDIHIEAHDDRAVTADGASYPRSDCGVEYPDYRKIMRDVSGDPDIVIDAALLIKLAKALTERNKKQLPVGMYFGRTSAGEIDPGAPVMVRVAADDDREGVIMPMRF